MEFRTPFSFADVELLVGAVATTLALFSVAFIASLAGGGSVGLLLSTTQSGGLAVARGAAAFISGFVRGVPLLIQMLFLFYGIALIGIRLEPFVSAWVALGIYGAATMAEIVRAAIGSVPHGQWLAARSIGMGYRSAVRYVIAPQAIKLAVPPTVGFAAQLLKGTSLASVLGFVELVRAGNIIAARTREPVIAFVIVGAIFMILVFPLLLAANRLERRSHSLSRG